MSPTRMALLFTLASGLALTACNRTDTAATAPSDPVGESGPSAQRTTVPPGFAKDYQELKSREKDPQKLSAGIRELLARYKLPTPTRSLPGPVTLPADKGEPATGFLGKILATTHWYMVKGQEFSLDFVMYKTMTIPANATLSVDITHDPATSVLDPFAVAFYKPANAPNPNLTKVTFVAIDDDAGGDYNSSFTWVNNTGASKTVIIIGSAYLPEVSGVGTLKAVCRTSANASCGSYTGTSWVSGVAVRQNENINASGCTGPTKSNISLNITDGGDHGPGVLAVNSGTMRGGFIYAQEGTLLLDDVLPAAYPNFVLGFSTGIGGFPCGRDGKSTCYETPNSYTLFQGDNYTCP